MCERDARYGALKRPAPALVAVLLVWTALLPASSGCSPRDPNVVLIVVDTLRADHLSLHGYARQISPTIDRLARDSVVFTDAMSHAPLTIPSVLQLMTGEFVLDKTIGETTETFAEKLSRRGYQTMAVIDNPVLELRQTGATRGFAEVFVNDVLDERLNQQHWKTKTPADVITRRAIRWLDDRGSSRPFLMWLHYFDPHDPYFPPYIGELPFEIETGSNWTGDVRRYAFSRERPTSRPAPVVRGADRQRLVDLYDAEIHYLDQSLSDLIGHLDRSGLYDQTLIVLTSDHGEAFGEHGEWTHGKSLHQSQIHVPLLIKLPQPDTRHAVHAGPVGLVDVIDTLCGYLEIESASRGAANDLLGNPPDVAYALWRTQVVAREGHWKLIHDEMTDASQLFDLSIDRHEKNDLSEHKPEVVARLRAAKDAWLRTTWPSYREAIEKSRAQFQQLRALGYLE